MLLSVDISGQLVLNRTDAAATPIDPTEIAGVQLLQGTSGGPYNTDLGVRGVDPAGLPLFSFASVNIDTDNGEAVVAVLKLDDGHVSVPSNEYLLPMPPEAPILD